MNDEVHVENGELANAEKREPPNGEKVQVDNQRKVQVDNEEKKESQSEQKEELKSEEKEEPVTEDNENDTEKDKLDTGKNGELDTGKEEELDTREKDELDTEKKNELSPEEKGELNNEDTVREMENRVDQGPEPKYDITSALYSKSPLGRALALEAKVHQLGNLINSNPTLNPSSTSTPVKHQYAPSQASHGKIYENNAPPQAPDRVGSQPQQRRPSGRTRHVSFAESTPARSAENSSGNLGSASRERNKAERTNTDCKICSHDLSPNEKEAIEQCKRKLSHGLHGFVDYGL